MSGRTPDEGRYSKVSRRMWDDERFQALSAPKPNAQSLWQRLLTGPELGCIPGLYPARLGGLADALKWPLKATRSCWQEIADQGMAEADWSAGLVWVPNAIVHNAPQSTNTVLGWKLALRELPECDLKRRATASIAAFLREKGEQWAKAFAMASGKSSPMATAMPSAMANDKRSRTQEQESGAGTRDPKEQHQDLKNSQYPESGTVPVVVSFEDREMPCPLDIQQRAEAAGVFVDLAKALKVHEAALRKEAHDFASYWTIGEGMGKRRRNWMGRLRQRLVERAKSGDLPRVDASSDPALAAQAARRVAAMKAEDDRKIAELNARAAPHLGSTIADLKNMVGRIGN